MLSHFVVLVVGFVLGVVAGNDILWHKVRMWLRTHLSRDFEAKAKRARKRLGIEDDD